MTVTVTVTREAKKLEFFQVFGCELSSYLIFSSFWLQASGFRLQASKIGSLYIRADVKALATGSIPEWSPNSTPGTGVFYMQGSSCAPINNRDSAQLGLDMMTASIIMSHSHIHRAYAHAHGQTPGQDATRTVIHLRK